MVTGENQMKVTNLLSATDQSRLAQSHKGANAWMAIKEPLAVHVTKLDSTRMEIIIENPMESAHYAGGKNLTLFKNK